MKQFILIIIFFVFGKAVIAQDQTKAITRACLNYVEGFYEGDSAKLIKSLKPSLYKLGYWKDRSGRIMSGKMTYEEAVNSAKEVRAAKELAKPDAIRKVEILSIGKYIAAAKVTVLWGVDYLLLSQIDGVWMIEEVLWEGN